MKEIEANRNEVDRMEANRIEANRNDHIFYSQKKEKKIMKRNVIASVLAMVLVALSLMGCATTDTTETTAVSEDTKSEDTDVETKPYKIAVGLPDSGATMFSLMSNNIQAYAKSTGGEVVFQAGVAASADATVQFVEDQIAAGVDGLIISPPADSVLTAVATLCEEAGVYWGITFRIIEDPEIKEFVESSPYYVGNCFEDEEETGYGVMKHLHENDIQKVAIISQAKGNTTTDLREKGAMRACDEFGMEIIAEARDLAQASDATSAAESFLTAYADLDAIFIVGTRGSGAHEAVAKAIEDAGRTDQVKLATIDFPDGMDKLFESGILITCSGLPSWGYDPYMISVVLANTCMGTPISETPVSLNAKMLNINDLDTAQRWIAKYGTDTTLYYDEDTMANTLSKAKNPDLTEEVMQKMIEDYAENAVN